VIGSIRRYLAEKNYGFVVPGDGGEDVFFHFSAFDSQEGAPPITGEPVSFEKEPDSNKALSVTRLTVPAKFTGLVTNYDPVKGYGFIRTKGGKTFYLHKSEVVSKSIPMRGATVDFYAVPAPVGSKEAPRACYVTVM